MSDIRFNQWLHNSGTGGVSQVDGGHVGIGTTNPLIPVGSGNTAILNVGVVTANSYYGDGSNLSGIVGGGTSLSFNDNIGAYFGNSQDLKIYHDGNHSYIDDQGTGNLRLRSGTLEIQNLAGNKTSAIFSSGGAQTLNFNNNTKFVTTNTGIDVTGSVVADDLIVTGTSVVADLKSTNNNYVLGLAGNNSSVKAYLGTDSSGNFLLATGSGISEKLRIASNGLIYVNGDGTGGRIDATAGDGSMTFSDGNGRQTFKIKTMASGQSAAHVFDASGRLGIGNTNPTTELDVKGNIRMRMVNGNSGVNSDNIALYMGMSDDLNQGKTAIVAKPIGSWGRHDLYFCLDNAADLNNVGLGDVKMILTNTGELWIGTTSGVSNSGYGGFSLNGSNGSLLSMMHNGTEKLRLYGHTNPSIQYAGNLTFFSGVSGGTERARITSDGKVKIGNSGGTPDGKLHIDEIGNGDIVAELTANSPMFTYRNGSGSWFHAGKHPSDDAYVVTTGGTTTSSEKFRIDGNGYVTKPNQPCMCVRINGAGINLGSNSDLFATYSSSLVYDVNVGNIAFNSSNGRWTVPVTGKYLVSYYSIKEGASVGGYVDIIINGVSGSFLRAYSQNSATSWSTYSAFAIKTLSAGDYINVLMPGTAQNYNAHGNQHLRFVISLYS